MQLAYWRERQAVNERALAVAAVEVGRLAILLEQLDDGNNTSQHPSI